MQQFVRSVIAIAAAAVLVGCSSTEPTRLCRGQIALTVESTNTTPLFRWPGGCAVSELLVSSTPNGIIIWVLRADQGVLLRSPLQYGIIPTGATENHTAPALQPGVNYLAGVNAVEGGDNGVGSGVASFSR